MSYSNKSIIDRARMLGSAVSTGQDSTRYAILTEKGRDYVNRNYHYLTIQRIRAFIERREYTTNPRDIPDLAFELNEDRYHNKEDGYYYNYSKDKYHKDKHRHGIIEDWDRDIYFNTGFFAHNSKNPPERKYEEHIARSLMISSTLCLPLQLILCQMNICCPKRWRLIECLDAGEVIEKMSNPSWVVGEPMRASERKEQEDRLREEAERVRIKWKEQERQRSKWCQDKGLMSAYCSIVRRFFFDVWEYCGTDAYNNTTTGMMAGFCCFMMFWFLTVANAQITPQYYGPAQKITPILFITISFVGSFFFTKLMIDYYFPQIDLTGRTWRKNLKFWRYDWWRSMVFSPTAKLEIFRRKQQRTKYQVQTNYSERQNLQKVPRDFLLPLPDDDDYEKEAITQLDFSKRVDTNIKKLVFLLNLQGMVRLSIFWALFLLLGWSYGSASFMDPGFIPRDEWPWNADPFSKDMFLPSPLGDGRMINMKGRYLWYWKSEKTRKLMLEQWKSEGRKWVEDDVRITSNGSKMVVEPLSEAERLKVQHSSSSDSASNRNSANSHSIDSPKSGCISGRQNPTGNDGKNTMGKPTSDTRKDESCLDSTTVTTVNSPGTPAAGATSSTASSATKPPTTSASVLPLKAGPTTATTDDKSTTTATASARAAAESTTKTCSSTKETTVGEAKGCTRRSDTEETTAGGTTSGTPASSTGVTVVGNGITPASTVIASSESSSTDSDSATVETPSVVGNGITPPSAITTAASGFLSRHHQSHHHTDSRLDSQHLHNGLRPKRLIEHTHHAEKLLEGPRPYSMQHHLSTRHSGATLESSLVEFATGTATSQQGNTYDESRHAIMSDEDYANFALNAFEQKEMYNSAIREYYYKHLSPKDREVISGIPDSMNSASFEAKSIDYCPTCHVFKPYHTKHCKVCNRCVAGWDHWCPFVGNFVAYRNYKAFCLFLIYGTTLSLFVVWVVFFEIMPIAANNPMPSSDFETGNLALLYAECDYKASQSYTLQNSGALGAAYNHCNNASGGLQNSNCNGDSYHAHTHLLTSENSKKFLKNTPIPNYLIRANRCASCTGFSTWVKSFSSCGSWKQYCKDSVHEFGDWYRGWKIRLGFQNYYDGPAVVSGSAASSRSYRNLIQSYHGGGGGYASNRSNAGGGYTYSTFGGIGDRSYSYGTNVAQSSTGHGAMGYGVTSTGAGVTSPGTTTGNNLALDSSPGTIIHSPVKSGNFLYYYGSCQGELLNNATTTGSFKQFSKTSALSKFSSREGGGIITTGNSNTCFFDFDPLHPNPDPSKFHNRFRLNYRHVFGYDSGDTELHTPVLAKRTRKPHAKVLRFNIESNAGILGESVLQRQDQHLAVNSQPHCKFHMKDFSISMVGASSDDHRTPLKNDYAGNYYGTCGRDNYYGTTRNYPSGTNPILGNHSTSSTLFSDHNSYASSTFGFVTRNPREELYEYQRVCLAAERLNWYIELEKRNNWGSNQDKKNWNQFSPIYLLRTVSPSAVQYLYPRQFSWIRDVFLAGPYLSYRKRAIRMVNQHCVGDQVRVIDPFDVVRFQTDPFTGVLESDFEGELKVWNYHSENQDLWESGGRHAYLEKVRTALESNSQNLSDLKNLNTPVPNVPRINEPERIFVGTPQVSESEDEHETNELEDIIKSNCDHKHDERLNEKDLLRGTQTSETMKGEEPKNNEQVLLKKLVAAELGCETRTVDYSNCRLKDKGRAIVDNHFCSIFYMRSSFHAFLLCFVLGWWIFHGLFPILMISVQNDKLGWDWVGQVIGIRQANEEVKAIFGESLWCRLSPSEECLQRKTLNDYVTKVDHIR